MKLIQEKKLILPTPLENPSLQTGEIGVFEARPTDGAILGGVVVIQEIFGVNAHIRSVARRYAERGYVAWAPAFFDHIKPDVELGYEKENFKTGLDIGLAVGWEQSVSDTRAAGLGLAQVLAANGAAGKSLTAIGFCWGGSLAWLANCRIGKPFTGTVSYYGRHTWDNRNEKAQLPALLHFGEQDSSIPLTNIQEFSRAQPQATVHLYNAGHGFNCDQREHYDFKAAQLADARTMEFLAATTK